MTYLAAALVLLGTLQLSVVVVLLAHLRGTTHANDRRVDKLLDRNDSLQDRLAHAEHHPWNKPPREENGDGELVEIDPALQLVEPGEEWEL